jgi:DNA-binding MarR family transcriptional regulator
MNGTPVVFLRNSALIGQKNRIKKDMSDNDEKYDINESLPLLMMTCVKHIREGLNSTFAKAGFDVTHEQWNILVHLAQQDGISQQVLADNYGRSKVSVLNLLKKLEKRKLVVRKPNPVDGRYNCVYLTTEGRKLQRTLIPLAKANIARMSNGLDEKEVEFLKQLTRKITQNISSK